MICISKKITERSTKRRIFFYYSPKIFYNIDIMADQLISIDIDKLMLINHFSYNIYSNYTSRPPQVYISYNNNPIIMISSNPKMIFLLFNYHIVVNYTSSLTPLQITRILQLRFLPHPISFAILLSSFHRYRTTCLHIQFPITVVKCDSFLS